MNRPVLILLSLLALSHGSIIYTVDVDRSGYASVTLSLESEESVEVYVPPDAKSFQIVGGSYSIRNSTAYIETGRSGFMTFSFSTDQMTTKEGQGWKLFATPPESSSVRIYMPAYATIENSTPKPSRIYSEDSRTLILMDHPDIVSVSYRLEETPLPAYQEDSAPLFAAAMIIAGSIVGLLLWLGRKSGGERKPSLQMSPGKREMMETFNENDLTIVNFLMSNRGKARRNLLERKTGISKSSLSMALARLEKRRIIEMDRSATTHFVKLSDNFLSL